MAGPAGGGPSRGEAPGQRREPTLPLSIDAVKAERAGVTSPGSCRALRPVPATLAPARAPCDCDSAATRTWLRECSPRAAGPPRMERRVVLAVEDESGDADSPALRDAKQREAVFIPAPRARRTTAGVRPLRGETAQIRRPGWSLSACRELRELVTFVFFVFQKNSTKRPALLKDAGGAPQA